MSATFSCGAQWAALTSAALLAWFAIAMAATAGLKSPLDYSVFSASAGALLLSPNAITVGASGAIFGLFGALVILERQGTYALGGSVMGLVILNVVFTFAIPNISIGGHLGGLIGGMLAMAALSIAGRHPVYGRFDLLSLLALLAIAAGSIFIAYLRVRGYPTGNF